MLKTQYIFSEFDSNKACAYSNIYYKTTMVHALSIKKKKKVKKSMKARKNTHREKCMQRQNHKTEPGPWPLFPFWSTSPARKGTVKLSTYVQ